MAAMQSKKLILARRALMRKADRVQQTAARVQSLIPESEKEPKTMSNRLNLREMSRDKILDKFVTDRSGYEIRDHVLRHRRTYALAGGITSMKFFKESVGNNGIDLQDTNMEENGRLPGNQDFVMEAIEIRAFAKHATEATRLADLVELLNTGVLQFNYKGKPRFSDGPLLHFVSRTSLIGIDSTSGDGVLPIYRLHNPIAIPGGDNWDVDILWPEGSPAITGDVDLDVRLIGQLIEAARD